MWMEPDSLILIQNQFIRLICLIHSFDLILSQPHFSLQKL